MTVQHLTAAEFGRLANPGIVSVQLLWPANALGAAATLTRVTMQPGAISRRHTHPHAEQSWVVEHGHATLLLADGATRPIAAGELVRTPAGAVHGVHNTGEAPFVYLAVTVPPQDFSAVCAERG